MTSDPKLEELFGLNTAKSEVNHKISLMANMMKASMDPMTLSHVVSHIKDKLKDPSEKGCTEAQRLILYAMRGRRFPPHHVFPGSPGRDGQLQRHAARRQGTVPGVALQRQSGGAR